MAIRAPGGRDQLSNDRGGNAQSVGRRMGPWFVWQVLNAKTFGLPAP